MRACLLFIVELLLIVLATACGDATMSNEVIAHNDLFVVGVDSVRQGQLMAWVDTEGQMQSNITPALLDSLYGDSKQQWQQRRISLAEPETLPTFVSQQPLVDATYRLSAATIEQALGGTHFAASASSDRAAITLALAALAPQQSMKRLRAMVKDGMIGDDGAELPQVDNHAAWIMAAWEVYCVTGDLEWLRWMHEVAERTLARDEMMLDRTTGLLRNAQRQPAATTTLPLTAQDRLAAMPLLANVLTAAAHDVLDDACEVLHAPNNHAEQARRLKDMINQQFWNEQQERYSAMLYGPSAAQRLSACDNLAQAIAVMWNIADDDRAEKLIGATPITHCGITTFHPQVIHSEPYFDDATWPITQTMWNMAAAEVGNENALRRGWGAMLRAQALFQSQHLTGSAVATDEVAMSAASLAMTLRVTFGVRYKADGIELHPFIAQCTPGDKHLVGLRYRDCTLNITVSGTGNDVRRITVDGTPIEGTFLPATLSGSHNIVVTMQSGHRPSDHVTLASSHAPAHDASAPLPADSLWQSLQLEPDSAGTWTTIATVEQGGTYIVTLTLCPAPAHATAIEIVANDHPQSHILVPTVIGDTAKSAITTIDLLAGDNRIDCSWSAPTQARHETTQWWLHLAPLDDR